MIDFCRPKFWQRWQFCPGQSSMVAIVCLAHYVPPEFLRAALIFWRHFQLTHKSSISTNVFDLLETFFRNHQKRNRRFEASWCNRLRDWLPEHWFQHRLRLDFKVDQSYWKKLPDNFSPRLRHCRDWHARIGADWSRQTWLWLATHFWAREVCDPWKEYFIRNRENYYVIKT